MICRCTRVGEVTLTTSAQMGLEAAPTWRKAPGPGWATFNPLRSVTRGCLDDHNSSINSIIVPNHHTVVGYVFQAGNLNLCALHTRNVIKIDRIWGVEIQLIFLSDTPLHFNIYDWHICANVSWAKATNIWFEANPMTRIHAHDTE